MIRAVLFVAVATALFVTPWALEIDWIGPEPGKVFFGVLSVATAVVLGWPALAVGPDASSGPGIGRGRGSGAEWGTTVLLAVLPPPFLALAAAVHGVPIAWAVIAGCGCATLVILAALLRRTPASRAVGSLVVLALVVGGVHRVLPRWAEALTGGPTRGSRDAGTAESGGGRLVRARVTLEGPLRSATVSLGGGAPLRIDAGPPSGLIHGERRTALGWVMAPADEELARRAATEILDAAPARSGPDARVRVELVDERAAADGGFDAIGIALSARSGPTLERPRRAPPVTALLLCLSVALAQVSLAIGLRGGRGQPATAGRALGLALGLVALSAVGAWGGSSLGEKHAARSTAAPSQLRVLEGQRAGRETRWLQVDRFRGELPASADVVADAGGSVRVVDPGVVESTRLALGAGAVGPAAPAAAVRVAPPNAPVDLLRPVDPGFRLVTEAVNTWGDFDAVWTLEAGSAGAWAARGAWPLGDPLPSETQGVAAAPPPAWLTRQLPQGVRVLVARLGPDAFAGLYGPAARPPGPSATWLRLVGF